jgi:hypothetical protein
MLNTSLQGFSKQCNGGNNQKWTGLSGTPTRRAGTGRGDQHPGRRAQPARQRYGGPGHRLLRTRRLRRVLDVNSDSTADGAALIQYTDRGSTNQQ